MTARSAPPVLIVDTDGDGVAVLARNLAALGYQATAVATAEEAVSAMGEQSFLIVLVNADLPAGGAADR
jgi:CheY-like chemotaxis protein